MPCKYHHCIPCHEHNIPVVDNFLNRPLETHVFALTLAACYALTPMRKINNGPTPAGALSQVAAHANIFMESFLKIEAEFPS